MFAKQQDIYTPEEYLALEEQAEYKNEYRRGQIVAMTGASLNHNRIVGNVYAALYNSLEIKSCEVFMSDLRLWIEQKELFTYPDVMGVCGAPEFLEDRTDTITNPKVIIEVLSKSTAGYDRGDKFQAYWTLGTFEEYVLIDQYRIHIEYFRRMSDKEWRLRILTKEVDILRLESVTVEIPVSKIYRNVTWEA